MSVRMIRIDDRLIHGQIVAAWAKNLSVRRIWILVKYPEVARHLFEAGVRIRELNVGGMGANADRKKLFKNISASEEERRTLKAMMESGVKVYFQVTPNEKQTLFEG